MTYWAHELRCQRKPTNRGDRWYLHLPGAYLGGPAGAVGSTRAVRMVRVGRHTGRLGLEGSEGLAEGGEIGRCAMGFVQMRVGLGIVCFGASWRVEMWQS